MGRRSDRAIGDAFQKHCGGSLAEPNSIDRDGGQRRRDMKGLAGIVEADDCDVAPRQTSPRLAAASMAPIATTSL